MNGYIICKCGRINYKGIIKEGEKCTDCGRIMQILEE